MPPNRTSTPLWLSGKPPIPRKPVLTTPVTPMAMLLPKTVAKAQGETPGILRAVVTIPVALKTGPGGRMVKLKVCVRLPSAARMETGPGVAPAVRLTVDYPLAPLARVDALRLSDPAVTAH